MSRISAAKIRVKVPHRKHPSQSSNICEWKPWEASTGARTPEGRARVSRNLPAKPHPDWLKLCKALKLSYWHTFHVDVMVDTKTARKLSPDAGWVDAAPVRIRARLSKNRQKILFWSIEQTYRSDASGQPVEDLKETRKRLDEEFRAIEKRLKQHG